MLLNNKNIVLTGASRGLGKSIAQTCWRHGANLLLVARSKEGLESLRAELSAAPVRDKQMAHVCVADLSKENAAEAIVNKALSHWNSTHALINNAGILGPIGKIWETDWRDWEATMRVNLFAPIELCRAFAPWMIQSGGGSIINLSGGGATSSRPNFAAYATAKTGLARFTEILAHEMKSAGVRANSIAPGALATDMLKEILDAGRDKVGAEEFDKVTAQAAKGGTPPEKAAELCAFLASDESKEITGKIFSAVWDPWDKLTPHLAELMGSGYLYAAADCAGGSREEVVS